MSQYSNAQPATNLEKTTCCGGSGASEGTHPNVFTGTNQTSKNPKLGAVTAGSSSKIPGK